MSLEDLSQDEKLELFDLADSFRVSGRICIERRSSKDSNLWVVVLDQNNCYCKKDSCWEYEPSPSRRDDDFIARTRYSLRDALAIVKSDSFVSQYLDK